MPIPLKARRAFPYAGRSLKAGQDFHALTKRDAHILIVIGHAERRQEFVPRVVTPAAEPDLEQMPLEDLRALAARLGVRVHHKAGAAKIRSAIRGARGE